MLGKAIGYLIPEIIIAVFTGTIVNRLLPTKGYRKPNEKCVWTRRNARNYKCLKSIR